jgi:hypothetical protein
MDVEIGRSKMPKPNKSLTMAQLLDYCSSAGLLHIAVDAEDAVYTVIPSSAGVRILLLKLDAAHQVLLIHAGNLLKVSPQRRPTVAMAAAHINSKVLLGAFYLDLKDGELAYDLPIPCFDTTFSKNTLLHCIKIVVNTLEQYMDALQRLCDGLEQVDEVIEL